jgi:hypothetical protein
MKQIITNYVNNFEHSIVVESLNRVFDYTSLLVEIFIPLTIVYLLVSLFILFKYISTTETLHVGTVHFIIWCLPTIMYMIYPITLPSIIVLGFLYIFSKIFERLRNYYQKRMIKRNKIH